MLPQVLQVHLLGLALRHSSLLLLSWNGTWYPFPFSLLPLLCLSLDSSALPLASLLAELAIYYGQQVSSPN